MSIWLLRRSVAIRTCTETHQVVRKLNLNHRWQTVGETIEYIGVAAHGKQTLKIVNPKSVWGIVTYYPLGKSSIV